MAKNKFRIQYRDIAKTEEIEAEHVVVVEDHYKFYNGSGKVDETVAYVPVEVVRKVEKMES